MGLRHFLGKHAVGLAALAGFAALGAYVLGQVQFTPPRVVYVAADPTRVDVNGSESGEPKQAFDAEKPPKPAGQARGVPASRAVPQRPR